MTKTDSAGGVERALPATRQSDDSQANGIDAFYIPGLGTYFRQIGDDDGSAFGTYVDAHLDKAMQWLNETVAKHPADKIVEIKLAAFGFSRGAALARAFARRVDAACDDRNGLQLWPGLNKPCSIYFMGLFDTVASVGTPASTSTLAFWIAKKWKPSDKGLDTAQRKAFFSLGQAWLCLDRAASMTEIALAPAPEVDGFKAPMQLGDEQVAALVDAAEVDALMPELVKEEPDRFLALGNGFARYRFTEHWLGRARHWKLEQFPQKVVLCTLALHLGPDFDKQPAWRDALSQVADGEFSSSEAVRQVKTVLGESIN